MYKKKHFLKLSKRQQNRRIRNNIINSNDINIPSNNKSVEVKTIEVVRKVVNQHNPPSESEESRSSYYDESNWTNELLNENIHFDNKLDTTDLHPINDFRLDLQIWAIRNNITHFALKSLLKVMSKHKIGNNLPLDPRSLLKTPRKNVIISLESGHYVHYGLEAALKDSLELYKSSNFPSHLFIDLNTDGLPLSNSSKSVLWPILGKIISHQIETKPFFIGAYHGYQKIQSNEDFLALFVLEYKRLNSEGFEHENQRYFVHINAFIADTPARNFILSFPAHNSYHGCGKCEQRGLYFKHRMTFPKTDCILRDDHTFRTNLPDKFKDTASPLEEIDIRLVTQVPLDPMHLVHLGVTNRLQTIWYSRESKEKKKELSTHMTSLNKYRTKEFAREFRSVENFENFKATENRAILLYIGPIIFKNFLSEEELLHFNTLHCAIRILSDPTAYIKHNSYANDLLIYFVETMGLLYGAEHLIFNVHNLIHLAADAFRLGPLESFSAFVYENFLHEVKKMIRKGDRPLSQICNRLIEKNQVLSNEEVIQQHKLLEPQKNFDMNVFKNKFTVAFDSIRLQNFTLYDKEPNNFCYLLDKTVICIKLITIYNNTVVVVGKKFSVCDNIPYYPCESKIIDVFLLKNLSNR